LPASRRNVPRMPSDCCHVVGQGAPGTVSIPRNVVRAVCGRRDAASVSFSNRCAGRAIMSRRVIGFVAAAAVACLLTAVPAGAPPPAAGFGLSHHKVCGAVTAGFARCHADVVDAGPTAPNALTPTGLSPATIKNVYSFSTSSTVGAGQTIAIVDAYDAPNIES